MGFDAAQSSTSLAGSGVQNAVTQRASAYTGTFRAKLVWHHDASKCLDVKDHKSFNGNTIQLYDCFDWDDDQYFLLPSFSEDKGNFGKIRWSKDPKMCLDVKNHKDFDGNVLQLWECFDDDADQNFMTPSEYAYAPIKWANHDEKCVDVKNQLSDNGNVIQIWDCGADNTFHNFDAAQSSTSVSVDALARSGVQNPVTQRASAYTGTFRAKLVWHHDASKCLDVKDHKSFNGNTIQLYDCFDWDDDQYFLLPSFSEDKGNFGKIRWSKD